MDNNDTETSIVEYLLSLLHTDSDDTGSDSFIKRMRRFIDEIPGGFLIYRANNNEDIIYANSALLNIFKCKTYAEFIDHTAGSFRGIVHPGDIDRVEDEIASQLAVENNNLDYVEYRIIRTDGIVRWVEDYGHYIHSDEAGDFFYVFITDATEKISKRMVETATLIRDKRENEQKLQNLIEEYDKERKLIRQEHLQRLEVIEGLSVNYDSILYADTEKNIVLPYRLSSRLERQFNKKLETRELQWFLDDYVNVWVHPDDRDFVRERTCTEYMRKKLSETNTYHINYRCVQNGEIQYIQLRLVNVSDGTEVNQIVMGYRNVDEEVLQEMQQKQLLEAALNKAKIADIAKNTFLSNMSHDMRTPLNAIFGYIQLARKATKSAAARKYLDKIECAGNQILDLVDKVLELSYAESHDLELDETEFSVHEVLSDVYGKALPIATNKNIALRMDAPSLAHDGVIADKGKLVQILNHIVSNAIKYTKPGGEVDISVSEKESSAREFAVYSFEVRDNGIGIAKSALKRIFEPFERESNTTESGVFGSGLGLTIAKQFAEMLGGKIQAKSTLGKGSTFTVTVSLRLQKTEFERPTDGESAPEIELKGKKILIVEDNEINLEIEKEILEDLGFVIDCAENGKVAVEKIAAAAPHDYDLIVMDIQMPVMDGRQAAVQIRRLPDPTLSRLPIIALSANALESDKHESLKAGMDAHLPKPIDIPLLLKTVHETLCRHARENK